jgi:hypothetical protein
MNLPAPRFDFMLSNPPYGKSWASELKYIKDGKDIIDPRFQVPLKDYWGNEEDADATPAFIRRAVAVPDGNGKQNETA